MKTTKEFISEAIAKFGDQYTYEKTVYAGSHKPVTVTCKAHGDFTKPARDFMASGCPHCSKRPPMTQARFINMAKEAHGDKYDYSETVYRSQKDKVKITCRVEGHGSWLVLPGNHIYKLAGCPVCAGNGILRVEEFIEKSSRKHNNKYDYNLVTSFKNSKDKVRIICPEHGEFRQAVTYHVNGQGCPKCAGKGLVSTASFVAEAIEVHGNRYNYEKVNCKTAKGKVTIICKEHGAFQQSYSNHVKHKQGCPKCAGKMKKTTEEFISDACMVHGDTYDYSLVDYKGKARKIAIICRKHGVFEQTPNTHLNGAGCMLCHRDAMTTSVVEFIVKAREIHGDKYDYDQVAFTRLTDKITITCPQHGPWEAVAADHVHKRRGCPTCSGYKLTRDEFIRRANFLHGDKYDYGLTVYDGYSSPVTITCPKHGNFTQTPDSHLQGKGCRMCANVGPSKGQREILDFISQHAKAVEEYKFDGSRRAFDIYLPEHKLAIEYNGIFWHSSKFQRDGGKEMEKYRVAEKHGVRTIFIFEDEWYFQPDTVKNTLLSAIGKLPKIAARKCKVEFLSIDDVRNFYMEHHIQGVHKSHIHIGLTYNGALVACMSFNMWRSNRTNTNRRHWELTRYAASHTVVGGASRLLKAFKTLEVADTLTSYSDVRMFSGKMYERLGFKKVHHTKPDYYYVNTRAAKWREHKSKFQKKHLVRLFPGCDVKNKTEKEICAENGYYQVFDCGKVRWDLTLA